MPQSTTSPNTGPRFDGDHYDEHSHSIAYPARAERLLRPGDVAAPVDLEYTYTPDPIPFMPTHDQWVEHLRREREQWEAIERLNKIILAAANICDEQAARLDLPEAHGGAFTKTYARQALAACGGLIRQMVKSCRDGAGR